MKKEYIVASFIAFLVLLLVNAPIIFFTISNRPTLHFLGRRVINSQDVYTYLSFVEQSRQGKWVFENLYTTESQTPSIIRPTYLLTGKLAAITHLSSVQAYHLMRILASLFFCVVLYCFLLEVFPRARVRLLAFVIVLTASGAGWLVGQYFDQASDLWIPESNVFMSLAESPHFILAQALMLTIFVCVLRFLSRGNKKLIVSILACSAFLAFDHPFDLLITAPVIILTGLVTAQALIPAVLVGIISMIGLLYPLYELRANPIFASEQAQGVSYSPSPISYVIGLGGLVPLALAGVESWWEEQRASVRLVIIWTVIGALMLYAPVSFQRRLSEGLSIPVSILATAGLAYVYRRLTTLQRLLTLPAMGILVLLLMGSSIRLIVTDFQTIGQDSPDHYYYYVSNAEYVGFEWLRMHTEPSDVILANWFNGNIIPGVAARRVYVGHKAQTIDFDEKVTNINAFLLEKDDEKALKFLHDNHITYIYTGNNDTMLQYGFKPEEKKYLEMQYDQEGAKIYKVVSSK